MIKKIIGYNFSTFFFGTIHIIVCNFFFDEKNFLLLKIYILLLPVNSLFFFLCLWSTINKKPYFIVWIVILQLFYNVNLFIYFVININILNSFRTIINFFLSYFM